MFLVLILGFSFVNSCKCKNLLFPREQKVLVCSIIREFSFSFSGANLHVRFKAALPVELTGSLVGGLWFFELVVTRGQGTGLPVGGLSDFEFSAGVRGVVWRGSTCGEG